MNRLLPTLLLVVLLSFGSTPIYTQDSGEPEVSGNITLTTDYSFRGWSQTTRDPAIQGGFDFEFDNGFTLGTWASNVNFGDSASTEIDLYVSYSDILMMGTSEISWSASFIRFEYPSEGKLLDYNEVSMDFSFGQFTAGLNYSNKYLGTDGVTFTYPHIGYSKVFEVDNVTFNAHAGFSRVNQDDFFADGEDSYMDFSFGFTAPIAGVDITAAVVGTSLDDTNDTEPRIILSCSHSF